MDLLFHWRKRYYRLVFWSDSLKFLVWTLILTAPIHWRRCMMNKWCNATFLIIFSDEQTNSWMAWDSVHFPHSFWNEYSLWTISLNRYFQWGSSLLAICFALFNLHWIIFLLLKSLLLRSNVKIVLKRHINKNAIFSSSCATPSDDGQQDYRGIKILSRILHLHSSRLL